MQTESKHTPGPWKIGELEECGGYDAMTAGIEVGPVTLDGADYGQGTCDPLTSEQQSRMTADAHLIAAAPAMYEALKDALTMLQDAHHVHPDAECLHSIQAALALAEKGE